MQKYLMGLRFTFYMNCNVRVTKLMNQMNLSNLLFSLEMTDIHVKRRGKKRPTAYAKIPEPMLSSLISCILNDFTSGSHHI